MSQPTPIKKSFSIPIPELDDSPVQTPTSKSKYQVQISPRGQTFIPILPLYGNLPRISGNTLVSIISGEYSDHFDNLYIIDCRYDYEYNGGHIKNAINCGDPAILYNLFFDEIKNRTLIIFHCEFSQNRGPQMAQIFREKDRELNCQRYPQLFYPHVFILDGGYSLFHSKFGDYCDGGYVSMFDEKHKVNGDLIRATNNFRQNVGKIESQCSLPFLMKYTTYDELKNPEDNDDKFQFQSPMATKMLRFLASPQQERSHSLPPPEI
ncbi:m-phase inducer phosphatase [Tritrichomonas musculus]|uniref:protein-tyrosine-phosphatase n=1 Tax=Tritrichomonas musculus TaxID=1915356 RepID=A0ABR2K3D0_9EUKA